MGIPPNIFLCYNPTWSQARQLKKEGDSRIRSRNEFHPAEHHGNSEGVRRSNSSILAERLQRLIALDIYHTVAFSLQPSINYTKRHTQ